MAVSRKMEKITSWRPWRELSAWKKENPMKREDAKPRRSFENT